MPRRRSRHQRLNLRQPVNWKHPINLALLAEWAVVPGRFGGTMSDLVCGSKLPNDGTLNAGATFSGKSHPGGSGSIAMDQNSSQYVIGPTTDDLAFSSGSDFTASVFVNAANLTTERGVFTRQNASGTTGGWGIVTDPSSGDRLNAIVFQGGAFTYIPTDAAMTTGVWYMITLRSQANTQNLFLNGKKQAATAAKTINHPSTARLVFGRFYGDTASFFLSCNTNEGMVWGRALADGEIAWLYSEIQHGNPNRWNWRRRTFAKATAVATVVSGWQAVHPDRYHDQWTPTPY